MHLETELQGLLSILEEKKSTMTSTSSMFMIEINIFTHYSKSWVLDIGCGYHLCNNMHELKNNMTLERNEVSFRFGNGARIAAVAIGKKTIKLLLCSGYF